MSTIARTRSHVTQSSAALLPALATLTAAAMIAATLQHADELRASELAIVAEDGRTAAKVAIDSNGAAQLITIAPDGSHASSISATGDGVVIRLGEGEKGRSLTLDARAMDLLRAMVASESVPVTPENLAVTVAALKQTSHSIEKEQMRLAAELSDLQRTVTMTGDEGRQGTLLRELSDLQREQQREQLRVSQRLAEMDQALDRLDRDVRDLQRRVR